MKKKKIERIIYDVVLVICFIFIVVYSIVEKNYKFLIAMSIIFGLLGLTFLIFAIKDKKINKTNKEFEDYCKKISEKIDRSVFEDCFVLAYDEKLEDEIRKELSNKNIKGVSSLTFLDFSYDTIYFSYKYNGFEVMFELCEDEITYVVDTPTKYDNTLENEEFENEKKASFNFKELTSISSFVNHFTNLISSINEEIDGFKEDVIVDDIFNGRLIDKTKSYANFVKKDGILYFIFGIVMALLFSFLFYGCLKEGGTLLQEVTLCICFPPLIIFFILATIRGIVFMKRSANYKKDFEFKTYEETTLKPHKISVAKESTRGGYLITKYHVQYIVLHYEKFKLFIPIPSNRFILGTKNDFKRFSSEALKINAKLKYLKFSKVVFDGENKYISTLRKVIERD